jgi:hypothetical protein
MPSRQPATRLQPQGQAGKRNDLASRVEGKATPSVNTFKVRVDEELTISLYITGT